MDTTSEETLIKDDIQNCLIQEIKPDTQKRDKLTDRDPIERVIKGRKRERERDRDIERGRETERETKRQIDR